VPGKVVSFSDYAKTPRKEKEVKQNMATVTNGYIFSLRMRQDDGSVIDYLAQLEAIDVPAKVGIYVQRLIKKLSATYAEIETARVDLVNKLGEKGEDGKSRLYLPGNKEGMPVSPNYVQFMQEFTELMAETTDIEVKPVILPGDTVAPSLTRLLTIFELFVIVEGTE